ncbi:MAG: pentapeptide repeat-containing protein [Janthinobacterium lividum]
MLTKVKYFRKDFSEQDLSKQDLSNSDFICCNFNKTNLTDCDCTNSIFTGSTMKGTICLRTNFRNAKLDCIFHPSDCMGMTLTLSCRTFTGMSISKLWWYGFMYCAMLMKPEFEAGSKDPRDIIIALMGSEKYNKMKILFRDRQI